jgi:hypothetical protein
VRLNGLFSLPHAEHLNVFGFELAWVIFASLPSMIM